MHELPILVSYMRRKDFSPLARNDKCDILSLREKIRMRGIDFHPDLRSSPELKKQTSRKLHNASLDLRCTSWTHSLCLAWPRNQGRTRRLLDHSARAESCQRSGRD